MTLTTTLSTDESNIYLNSDYFISYLKNKSILESRYCLFLDIDGTLAEFTVNPKDSFVPQATLNLLDKIQQSGVQIAAVTGRSLVEAKNILSPLNLPIAATHGLEIELVNLDYEVDSVSDDINNSIPSVFDTRELEDIKKRVQELGKPYPELLIENKPCSCALHYRQTPSLANKASAIMQNVIRDFPSWTLKQGKFVWEVVPKGVNKGTAILTLLDKILGNTCLTNNKVKRNLCAIFIGDDVTDEAGFIALQNDIQLLNNNQRVVEGIGIKVGSEPTNAKYRVKDIKEVVKLLESFLKFLASQDSTKANTKNTTL